MEKAELLEIIKKVSEGSKKRNFKQSYDLIINLKDIDLKKTEQQINLFMQLNYGIGRKLKVCAMVGAELLDQAKAVCDNALFVDDFEKYADKKKAKKLADEYNFFIAQATIMPKLATVFGKVFGPRGKMPNPKAGCVVPPTASLKPLYEKLQKTIRVATKNDPIIQCPVGKEGMSDEEIADNILTIYNSLLRVLPNEKHNINSVYLKLTMGKPFRV